MSNTVELAKRLGLIQEIFLATENGRLEYISALQGFKYLIIIDFESTCWNYGEKYAYPNEIIEFPALLMDTKTGSILSTFHHYVQPMEQPILSKFCSEFTGITQAQVDSSSPLDVVMSKFRRWLTTISDDYKVTFNKGDGNSCAFVTWTNWDLGVCLTKECRRKGITIPEQMLSWIDLKAIYKRFYKRQPKGLKESMLDVGLQFEGREHSGIVDSRNTARLLFKMIQDDCCVQLTTKK